MKVDYFCFPPQVSTMSPEKDSHVVCVYTKNYLDVDEVSE
jgi:hypothetical protein